MKSPLSFRPAARAGKKRPRVAVCISGEFRHVHHRTPEHHVRQLKSFLLGSDCDVYIHGWSNSSEALILSELRPCAWLFEPRPDLSRLAGRVRLVEPDIKPGRDQGSLAMFYGIERCFELVEAEGAGYDYVVRVRPDLHIQVSLREIIDGIEKHGRLPNTVYVPHLFHSKGINDQLAVGSSAAMKTYSTTYSFLCANIERAFFNPEAVLLRRILDSGARIALAEIPYALMREVPIRINTVFELFERQRVIWWSRTEWLPRYQDVTRYFADKLRAMNDAMEGTVPPLLYLRVARADRAGGAAVVRTRAVDNDPARHVLFLFRRWGLWRIAPGMMGADGASAGEPGPRQVFVSRQGGGYVMSEWRLAGDRLVHTSTAVADQDASPVAKRLAVRMGIAFWLDRRRARRSQ